MPHLTNLARADADSGSGAAPDHTGTTAESAKTPNIAAVTVALIDMTLRIGRMRINRPGWSRPVS